MVCFYHSGLQIKTNKIFQMFVLGFEFKIWNECLPYMCYPQSSRYQYWISSNYSMLGNDYNEINFVDISVKVPACKRILNDNHQCVWYLWAQYSVPFLDDLIPGISSAILQWKLEFTEFLCEYSYKDTAALLTETL